MAASFFIEPSPSPSRSSGARTLEADLIVEVSPTRFFITKNRFGSCAAFTRAGFAVFIEKLTHEIGAPVSVAFSIKQRTP